MAGISLLSLVLALTPFSGPALPGSVSDSAKFSVGIRGKSGQLVHLRAVGVPRGFIASFCTSRVCAPFAVSLVLPQSGRDSIEMQLIENVRGARKPKIVTVAADGSSAVSIPYSRATDRR